MSAKGVDALQVISRGVAPRLVFLLGFLLTTPSWAAITVTGAIQVPEGVDPEAVRVRLVPIVAKYELAVLRLSGRVCPEPVSESTLSQEGWYRLTAPEAGMWKVVVSAPGAATSEHLLLPLTDDVHLSRFSLQREVPLDLEVRGLEGGVLPGVRIATFETNRNERGRTTRPPAVATGLTDSTGKLRLEDLPGEEIPLIALRGAVEHPELRASHGRLAIPGSPLVEYRIELQETTGEPVEGAIALTRQALWPVARSTAEGVLLLEIPRGQEAELMLITPDGREIGFDLRDGTDPLDDQERTLNVTFPNRAEPAFSGLATDAESGQPVAGAIAWIEPRTNTTTGQDGSYTLPESSRVSVDAPGYSPRFWVGGVEGRDLLPPPVELHRSMTLAGRLLDEQSRAVTHGRIRASLEGAGDTEVPGWLSSTTWITESGSGGRFFFNKLLPGDYRVTATAEGHPVKEMLIRRPRDSRSVTDLEIVLGEGATISGRVVDPTGQPVAGARISTLPREGSRGSGQVRTKLEAFYGTRRGPDPRRAARRASATSGKDGGFTVEGLANGWHDLVLTHPGFEARVLPGIELTPERTLVDLGPVELDPGTSLEGRVVNPDGEPIGGVRVHLVISYHGPAGAGGGSFPTRDPEVTDSEGLFVFENVPGTEVGVGVAGSGHTSRLVPGIALPQEEPLEIILDQTARVLGRVVDREGAPLSGVLLAVQPAGARLASWSTPGQQTTARSGADGTFEIPGASSGRQQIVATKDGFKRETLLLDLDPGDEARVELVLDPGFSVEGRVFSADGSPVAGARVAAGPASTTTDGEGRYRLDALPGGALRVAARHLRHGSVTEEAFIAYSPFELDLRLLAGLTVAGVVVDPEGAPVAEAPVQLVAATGPRRVQATGEDGTFDFAGLTAGAYRLETTADGGHAELAFELDGESRSDLTLVLRAPSTVSGRVLGASTEELGLLSVWASGGGRVLDGRLSRDGSFVVEGVSPGEWLVGASLPTGGRMATERIEVPEAGSDIPVDLELGDGLLLTGELVADGRPVDGARVTLRDAAGSPAGAALTGLDGRFRIEGLEPGRYALSILSRELSLEAGREVHLDADEELRIELRTASLSGLVIDAESGLAVEDVAVAAQRLDADRDGFELPPVRGTSDRNGRFHLGRLPLGRYLLSARRPGYELATVEWDLAADSPGTTLVLSPSPPAGE